MHHTPRYLMTDPDEVKRLIRHNPWATFVSPTSTGLIASHYPVLLEDNVDDITIVSHFGRPDDEVHELGQHQMLVIIQGPHDYVSSSWYAPGDLVPTWNHVTAHLYGTLRSSMTRRTMRSSPGSRITSSGTSPRGAVLPRTRPAPGVLPRALWGSGFGWTDSMPAPS